MMALKGLLSGIVVFLAASQPVFAWDSVGHRLTAGVALHFISPDTRAKLLEILAAHPRYQEDFQTQIPAFIDANDQDALSQWLLGQAAYWPDIARGLPGAERDHYNRPPWHYTDGAWLRGSAVLQGNLYLGIDARADQWGREQSSIVSESDAHNVVTALDYNTRLLADQSVPKAARAIALCWVLHLMGDIHQPMHTGSLYSAHTFANGDLGGNRIPVTLADQTGRESLNLHAAWDGALREFGVAASLPDILALVSGFTAPRIDGVESEWTAWMSESRQLLSTVVYTDAILAAARVADSKAEGELSSAIRLTPAYVSRMQEISRQRLGLAGLRLAIWFENELP